MSYSYGAKQKLGSSSYYSLPDLPDLPPKKSWLSRHRAEQLWGLLLVSPWLIGLLLFKLLPILASLGISFSNFELLTPEETQFVGLENYTRLFHDPAVGYVLFETLALAIVTVPFQAAASVILASLLSNPRLKGRTLLRTLFFLPSIIPSVAILFMWIGFSDPKTGWLALFFKAFGIGNVYAQGLINLFFAVSSLWSIGPGMLIMMGAMQGVPPELHEAARVDGAGPFFRFFNVTLPMISPALFFTLIINLITIFGGVILLDRGNVFSGSISPYDGYVTYILFNQLEFGYASSLAWVFFVIVMFIIAALFSSSRRWVYYSDRGG
jgi:multiple sugar transport system permease protein